MRYDIVIDAEHADKFVDWFKNRAGVLVWKNLEIGGGAAREVFTPASTPAGNKVSPDQPPNWRYGEPEPVDEASVRVLYAEPVHQYKGRFKRYYWGPGVHPNTETKAERECAKFRHKDPDNAYGWIWDYEGYGLVNITIRKETAMTFAEYKERRAVVVAQNEQTTVYKIPAKD